MSGYNSSENIYPTKEFIRNLLLLIKNEKQLCTLKDFAKNKYSIMDGSVVPCIDGYLIFLVRETGYIELQTCEYILEKSSLSIRMPFSKSDMTNIKIEKKGEIAIRGISDALSCSKSTKDGKPDTFLTLNRSILGVYCNLKELKDMLDIMIKKDKKNISIDMSRSISKDIPKHLCDIFKSYLAYRLFDLEARKKQIFGMELYAFFLCVSDKILPSIQNRDLILKDIESNKKYKIEYESLIYRRKIGNMTREATGKPFDLYSLDKCNLIDRLTPNITESMCAKVPPMKDKRFIVLRKRLSYVDEIFIAMFLSESIIDMEIPLWAKPVDTKEKNKLTSLGKLLDSNDVSVKELERIHMEIGITDLYANKYDKLNIKAKGKKISELRWHLDALRKYICILYSYKINNKSNKRWCDNCSTKNMIGHKCIS